MIEQLQHYLRQSFLLRWVLANMVGWTLGLYLATISINSWLILLLAGLVYGAVVGAAQRYVLRHHPGVRLDRWVTYSLYAGICGTLASIIFIVAYLVSGERLLAVLVGGVIGASIGTWQSSLVGGSVRWWIAANVLGGALCGLLTTFRVISGLPIGLLAGAAIFGYITGRTLEKIHPDN